MIKTQQKKLEVGRWFFRFSISRDWMRMMDYTKVVTVMAVKPIRKPPEGAELRKGDYKGIYFQMRVWFPFAIDRWK